MSNIRFESLDLLATTPNAAPINGMGQLVKQNGSVSTWVQAGGNVYWWGGDSVFTPIDTLEK